MTIKLTLKTAGQVYNGIIQMPELQGKVAYWLGRIQDNLESQLYRYNKEVQKLAKEFGEMSEDKKQMLVPLDKMEAYEKSREELDATEIEIPWDKIKMSDILGKNEEKQPMIKPVIWGLIAPIIEE